MHTRSSATSRPIDTPWTTVSQRLKCARESRSASSHCTRCRSLDASSDARGFSVCTQHYSTRSARWSKHDSRVLRTAIELLLSTSKVSEVKGKERRSPAVATSMETSFSNSPKTSLELEAENSPKQLHEHEEVFNSIWTIQLVLIRSDTFTDFNCWLNNHYMY